MQGEEKFEDFKVILPFYRSSNTPVTSPQPRNYLEEIGVINYKVSLQ